jgi:glycine/D-amino acid oxidase-like deaminating enzyme
LCHSLGSYEPSPGKEDLTWEIARPDFYMRTTKEARILMGGEDDNFNSPKHRDARVERRSKKLVKCFRAMVSQVGFNVDYNWAGRLVKQTGAE